MTKNSGLTLEIYKRIDALLEQPQSPGNLNMLLRLLAKWRSAVVQNTLIKRDGIRVISGVFEGMEFIEKSSEGCHVPKLIGCYEQPLQPYIEAAIKKAHPVVINIGCAEGYYAVGLARRMPNAKIYAYDIDANGRETCANLAEKNGVSDQVVIGELFTPADFSEFENQNALVICDIEGAEKAMLDPVAAPALKTMDIIVECHEEFVPGITNLLKERFKQSHDIAHITDIGHRQIENPKWLETLGHMDQLIASWEWRGGPTPWLALTQKKPNRQGKN
ncbi:MAG: hypothetical protein JKY60_11180 [Kordiimonadaceae bacterium]|nr:hypothetical protein [Kordiimonadaceae bacterium]